MKLNFNETKFNNSTDFKVKMFQKGTQDWVLLIVLILVGALIGFAFSFIRKPIYEATALVTTNLQLNKEGSVSEFMMDSQINHIGELYFNPIVIQRLLESHPGLELNLTWLKEHGTVERRMLNTLIKVRHTDPEIAAKIASSWAEMLFKTLEDVYPIAVEVSAAKNTLTLLENCANPKNNVAINTFCSSMTKADYDQALEYATSMIAELGDQTLGLSEYLNVSQYQPAVVPNKPISYHRGTMILSGSMLGFLVTLGYFLVRKQDE